MDSPVGARPSLRMAEMKFSGINFANTRVASNAKLFYQPEGWMEWVWWNCCVSNAKPNIKYVRLFTSVLRWLWQLGTEDMRDLVNK